MNKSLLEFESKYQLQEATPSANYQILDVSTPSSISAMGGYQYCDVYPQKDILLQESAIEVTGTVPPRFLSQAEDEVLWKALRASATLIARGASRK